MEDLRIVIPAYDEEAGIGTVIDRVRKACREAEVVVIDDASTDNTPRIASQKGVKVVSNPTNYGKGGATKVGFNHNLPSNIRYLAFIDADNTYPPETIPKLYQLCKEQQIKLAVGSRFLGNNGGMPTIRRLGNRIFANLLSLYSGRKTTDTSTGLRVFDAELLPMVNSLPDGLEFDLAMTAHTLFQNLSYAEVAVEYDKRMGMSKLNSLKDGYRFLKIIMNATKKYRPLKFYITLGIPFLIVQSSVNLCSTIRNKLKAK